MRIGRQSAEDRSQNERTRVHSVFWFLSSVLWFATFPFRRFAPPSPYGGRPGYAHRASCAAVTLIAIVAADAAHACVPSLQGDTVRVMRSAAHAVAWRSEPAVIPLGAHFTVELAVCVADGRVAVESVVVDAEMPEHRHGMNYRPGLSSLGGGRYRAEGLLFHMPGRWRLIVEVRAGGSVERLTDDLMVE